MTCRSPFAFGLRQKLLQDQRVSAQVADRNYLLSNDYFLTDILQTLLFYKSFSVICIYDLAHNVIEDMKLLQHFDFFNLQNFILFLFSCIVWHSVFFLLHYRFSVFYCHCTLNLWILYALFHWNKAGKPFFFKKKIFLKQLFSIKLCLVLKYSVNIAKKKLKDQNNNCSLYSCCVSMKRSTV